MAKKKKDKKPVRVIIEPHYSGKEKADTIFRKILEEKLRKTRNSSRQY